mgnify:CR=1 FL=1
MAKNFKVNLLTLSGQSVTAAPGALYLNGVEVGGGGGVTQPQLDALSGYANSQFSATGNALVQRDLSISGALQAQIGAPASPPRAMVVPFVTNPVTATNMAAALGFFAGSAGYVTFADLTQYTGVRFVVNKTATAGAAASRLFLRYRSTFNATASNWTTDLSNPNMMVAVNNQNAMTVSGYQPIAAGALGPVYIALMGTGGDGALDPAFGHIEAHFL